jgi:hypothetical protein
VDEKAGEISAMQNAMNLRLRMRDQFAAECQNEPALPQVSDQALTVDQVMEKTNGYRRGEVPLREWLPSTWDTPTFDPVPLPASK